MLPPFTMMNAQRIAVSMLLMLSACLGSSWAAEGTANPERPHAVIDKLLKEMYHIANTTGRFDLSANAEHEAAMRIREYLAAGGPPEGLTERDDVGFTPLMRAAFMGYPEITRELLKFPSVKSGIDDVCPKGITAWMYANFGPRQTLWVCNPLVVNNVSAWVRFAEMLPLYDLPGENRYRQTGRILESEGARTDPRALKKAWLGLCPFQDSTTRKKVEESDDVLATLIYLTSEKFVALRESNRESFMEEQQKEWAVFGARLRYGRADSTHPGFVAYAEEVQKRFDAAWRIPLHTKDLVTLVTVQIARDGRMIGFTIDRSSGTRTYDAAVVRALRSAGPLPPIPESLGLDLVEVGLRFLSHPKEPAK